MNRMVLSTQVDGAVMEEVYQTVEARKVTLAQFVEDALKEKLERDEMVALFASKGAGAQPGELTALMLAGPDRAPLFDTDIMPKGEA